MVRDAKLLASNLQAGTSRTTACPGILGQHNLISRLIQCKSLLAKEKHKGLLDKYLGCLVSNVQIPEKNENVNILILS